MLRTLATAIDTRKVRIASVVLGLVVTAVLGPLALFGAYASLVSLSQGHINDLREFLSSGVAGLGGVIGLAGAWCRVVLPNSRFQESRTLYFLTCAALGIGALAAALVFFVHSAGPVNPTAWLFAALAGIGVLLLAATIGARANAT